MVSEEIRIVGPNGEKVDVMTFRGSFEQDIKEFVEKTPDLKEAVEAEDDDAIETIVNERFYHRPEMFYSPDKLIVSYGVPAPTPAFVYNAVGKKPLPTTRGNCHRHGGFHRRSVQSALQRTEMGGRHRTIARGGFHSACGDSCPAT